ncbi:MAG: hypothetical protein V4726_23045, partial [Verrucomicrobiota bacterium]
TNPLPCGGGFTLIREFRFDETAAVFGARLLFRAAWCYLQRDTGRDEVARLLLEPPPSAAGLGLSSSLTAAAQFSTAAQFSADLTLQHLPAIFRMARALAPGDPLLAALRELAGWFPLSGIGIQPADPQDFPAIDSGTWENLQAHPGLRQLFLDRILSARARHWLKHPDITLAIRHSLGEYATDLAPSFDLPVPLSEKIGPV